MPFSSTTATARMDLPPSLLIIFLATALASGLGGYYIGASSNRIRDLPAESSGPEQSKKSDSSKSKSPITSSPSKDSFENISATEADGDDDDDDDEDSDSDAMIKSDYSHFSASALTEECKMVLCVRTDLGMTKGKIAAQCGHATLACYKAVSRHAPLLLKRWEYLGQAKIALKVDSEDDLLTLQAQAMSLGLVAKVVRDAGRTQIASGSATVLGIGPAPKSVVNQITGHLKLL
ncbi:hypothetical protein TWF569_007008 [Orbilia oligospora]|uniref:peptidyl-tRNA hydrolase n=2 Tax=Orbilia oligospora TaxID=2813651 RepID=A0A7C8PRQ5_ORBOL|nr:hypothetical protein TWF706_003625 [Orbilia oligospora]KAF3082488.1 hypothetical protein TWF102_001187 [Orbilia oligospora]KAF3108533.1 hypothetical protein TWF103_005607 [Orbilia oligospora]KAF3128023.1 hypothetical protein TWF703_009780 [Orbilia oligospora]KAF3144817.1 hypothetical protein TWF569_007008 [Orbilia oligospora]